MRDYTELDEWIGECIERKVPIKNEKLDAVSRILDELIKGEPFNKKIT